MDKSKKNPKDRATPKRRRSFTNLKKLEIIEFAEKNGNRAAGRAYEVDEKCVRDWRNKVNTIKKSCPKARANGRGGKAKWPELEKELVAWIEAQREHERAVSTVAIRLQAKVVAKIRGIENFNGGPSWVHRFMKRHKLVIRARTTVGQKLPEGWEGKVRDFHEFVHRIITTNTFSPCKVGNMDEVPMSFDIPNTRTVNTAGEKTVKLCTTGHDRTNFTVVLTVMADGAKLPPMIIFKRVTMPREKFPPPSQCVVQVNRKGWMNQQIMDEWVQKCWRKRPGSLFSPDSLLVMDSMATHKTEETKKLLKDNKSQLAIIPGGLTCKLQPLDVGCNRPFKVYLRQEWEEWMLSGEHEFTPAGKQKKAKFSVVAEWVVRAWAKVKTTTVVNSFRKTELLPGMPPLAEYDSETDSEPEEEARAIDPAILDLFNSDSEGSDFEGFDSSDCDDDE